ncbi:hypothetical protein N7478_010108 [Penicillium angulare]|uniref:uncharacterized protein n=1 Tax=Penicillium angulare TaxID=116970 RepID=UPI00253FDD10|nr:uncharacterized protein N7478_010108 [Penicillium angulare]KAJ5267300.1 hypothetical protein N7478_010108 [Penicillium angulare]
MSYPILPMGATSATYVKKHYPALLKNVVHDCTDTIDGIYLFNDLVSAKGNIANETPGFKEYDAHGGDMACHIRAGMLQELYEYHHERTQVTGRSFLDGDVIRQYVDQLHIVRKNAQHACLQLTKRNVNPEKLGIPLKRDTASHIMEVLGWNIESVGSPGIYSPCATPGSRNPSTSSSASGSSSGTPSGSQTLADAGESGSLSSFSAMSISSSISSTSGVSDVDSLTFPKWNVEDSRMAVLFLAATSTLSNFKEFARMGSRITVRFVPKKALDAGNEVIQPYWDRSNTNYADFGINRIKDRNGFLQKWISRLSCSWIQTWATNLGLSQDLQRYALVNQLASMMILIRS